MSLYKVAVIIFHFEGMSFSSAHDLKQWDFLDNNEIFSEFAQFIRQHITKPFYNLHEHSDSLVLL